jgi:hypothetical protein
MRLEGTEAREAVILVNTIGPLLVIAPLVQSGARFCRSRGKRMAELGLADDGYRSPS